MRQKSNDFGAFSEHENQRESIEFLNYKIENRMK